MAITKIKRISTAVFLLTVFISLVVMGIFMLGGQATEEQMLRGASLYGLSQPRFLDWLIVWTYILVVITVITLLIFTIRAFIIGLRDNPKRAIGGFIAFLSLVAMLFIMWALGSGEILHIPGYDGNHNVPFWLRISDMWIFSIYAMIIINILAIIFVPLFAKRK